MNKENKNFEWSNENKHVNFKGVNVVLLHFDLQKPCHTLLIFYRVGIILDGPRNLFLFLMCKVVLDGK